MNEITIKSRLDSRSNNTFIDFLIDGKSLFDICNIEGSNRIGSLGWGINIEYEKKIVRQFLNEEKMKNYKVRG